MKIEEIKDKDIWENFLLGCKEKTFLQSWNWGEFQKIMRGKIWRFGVFEQDKLVSVALVVRVAAKRGKFLLIPHGPVVKEESTILRYKILGVFLEHLKQLAKTEGASFIRINPIWKRNEENKRAFTSLGFQEAPMQTHPEASWKLDLSLPEEELLKNMRKTTRYLIRQAQKNEDITIEKSNRVEDVKTFSELHKKVSERQRFAPFSFEYLENEFSAFQKDEQVLLFLGKYKGDMAAASFVVFWSGIAFYHHAVSLPKFAKHSIPYLLQLEAIKEAKRRGCVLYDFWGYVNPAEQPKHPWAGPTLFKMGFGGEAHKYVKDQDFPLSWKYWFTAIFEKIRKARRHL